MQSGAHISARTVYVGPSGALHVGSQEDPARDVTLYLDHSPCEALEQEGDFAAATACRG